MESPNVTALTNSSISLLEKLKPSARNRLISKKYNIPSDNSKIKNENTLSMSNNSQSESKNWGLDLIQNEESNSNFNDKWNKIVKERKIEALHLDLSSSALIQSAIKLTDDCSILSENLENLNNFIEEKYQMNLTENIFIRNPNNYHSFIPFILISSREIHRATLSDYEIKLVYKSFKSKIKQNRVDGYDYYRLGIIYFYQGKYTLSYLYFKSAYKIRKEISIAKWLVFNSMIIIFCYKNSEAEDESDPSEIKKNPYSEFKIDFTFLKSIKISSEIEENETSESFLFGCCSRKKKSQIQSESSIYIKYDYLMNLINSQTKGLSHNSLEIINKSTLCTESVNILNEILNNSTDKLDNHIIEILWILILISIYIKFNPTQKNFPKNIGNYNLDDAKNLIKSIKEKDPYLAYLFYSEYHYLLDVNFNMKPILTELIIKYPYKFEGYLRLWDYLVKSELKDYKLANQLCEILWKNSSTVRLDNSFYYLYIVITHAKSLYYLGNNFYTITYFQKEYPANFLYPSIYYLFAKYSSKSNTKNLKSIALSSLTQVHNLLFDDLKKMTNFWIGNVYYNAGNYELCYNHWKFFFEKDNNDYIYELSPRKLEKILNFKKNYELLGSSLCEFKKNINYFKNHNKNKQDTNTNFERLKDFLIDLQAIKELQPNIRDNFSYFYEYKRGLIHFNVENNMEVALQIFMNVINTDKLFFQAYFQIWKILKKSKENKILLNFSYFMIRQSHDEEISNQDWLKSYLLYSKALFLNERHEDAIQLILNVLDIFVHIPLDEVKFLSEVHKSNKVFSTNNIINFDFMLSFYSKYHVYKKSEAIFHFNYKSKSGKEKFLMQEIGKVYNSNFSNKKKIVKSFLNRSTTMICGKFNKVNKESINDDLQNTIYLEENLSDEEKFKPNNLYFLLDSKIADLNINTNEKLEEYIEKNIEKIEVSEEYAFITIISDPILLYTIGKLCAKSELKIDMGLYCLNDYVCILKFQNNYNLDQKNLVKKYKAYFYMARIYCYQRDYKNAFESFQKIKKIKLIEGDSKKFKILKAYYDFYKRYQNSNTEIFKYEIFKE